MTHFNHPLTFQDLCDTTVDALFAADDMGNVAFVSATLGAALVIDAAQAERIAGADWAAQMQAVSDWWAEQDPRQFAYGYFREAAE